MQAPHEGQARPQTTKPIDKLWERIGRLKARSHGVGQHYSIEIVADATGKTAQAIRWERQPVAGTMLTDLESVFRSLKSVLGLRPVLHRTEGRVDGHLFITVLAYQFVQLIRRRLRAHAINDRWSILRETLAGQCRVTTSFRRADGRRPNFFAVSE